MDEERTATAKAQVLDTAGASQHKALTAQQVERYTAGLDTLRIALRELNSAHMALDRVSLLADGLADKLPDDMPLFHKLTNAHGVAQSVNKAIDVLRGVHVRLVSARRVLEAAVENEPER